MHAWACVPPERTARERATARASPGRRRPAAARGKSRPRGLAGHSFRPAARLPLFSAGARASSAQYGRGHPRRPRRVLFSGRSRSRIDGCSNLFSPAIDRLLLGRGGGREERPIVRRTGSVAWPRYTVLRLPSGGPRIYQRPQRRRRRTSGGGHASASAARCSFVIVHLPAALPHTFNPIALWPPPWPPAVLSVAS